MNRHTIAFCLALGGFASAQSPLFADGRDEAMPEFGTATHEFFVGDFTGDGTPDVFQSTTHNIFSSRMWDLFGGHRLLVNSGSGRFENIRPVVGYIPSVFTPHVLDVADLDGDGDLDALREDGIEINDGTGVMTFTPFGSYVRIDGPGVMGDVNGDQRPDVWNGRLRINGPGVVFVDETAARLPGIATVSRAGIAMGDVDGDTDLDLFGGGRMFRNDGTGVFSEDVAFSMPANATRAKTSDLDGDTDLDLIYADGSSFTVRLNDGTGAFNATTYTVSSDVLGLGIGDVDGISGFDVLVGLSTGWRIFRNDGTGGFVPDPNVIGRNAPTTAFAILDADNDGDQDVIQGTSQEHSNPLFDEVFYNDGTGSFTESEWSQPVASLRGQVAAGDFDGDGDVDCLSLEDGVLLRNNGWGEFISVALGVSAPGFIDVGDVDGDGDLDAVVARSLQQNAVAEVYRNDGTGAFQLASTHTWTLQPPNPYFLFTADVSGVCVGDLDGDNRADALVLTGKINGPNPSISDLDRLLLGDSAAVLTPAAWGPTDRTLAFDAEFVDFDGDGDLDVLTDDGLYTNDPGVSLTLTRNGVAGMVGQIAVGDLDNDGNLDIAMGNNCGGGFCFPSDDRPQQAIRWGGSSGTFTTQRLPHFFAATDVRLADYDEDGDLDIFYGWTTASWGWQRTMLLTNEGARVFRPASSAEVPPFFFGTDSVIVEDFDSDGDPDLLQVTKQGGGLAFDTTRLFSNLRVQTRAPYRFRMGHPFICRVHGGDVSALALSFGETSIPIPPFGVLGLASPTIALALGPSVAGVAELQFTPPVSPALAGVDLFWQGLTSFTSTGEVRLTNRIRERALGN